MRVKKITIVEIEYVAFSLAEKFLSWDEPIPNFGTRFPNVLESCVATPFGKFNRKDLYRGLIGKGSMLFYLMIKNHPFQNGNKRIAITSLLYLLSQNGKWLKMKNSELYDFAKKVAKSNPEERHRVMEEIQVLIKKHLINL